MHPTEPPRPAIELVKLQILILMGAHILEIGYDHKIELGKLQTLMGILRLEIGFIPW